MNDCMVVCINEGVLWVYVWLCVSVPSEREREFMTVWVCASDYACVCVFVCMCVPLCVCVCLWVRVCVCARMYVFH